MSMWFNLSSHFNGVVTLAPHWTVNGNILVRLLLYCLLNISTSTCSIVIKLPRFCLSLLKFLGVLHWHHMMYKYDVQIPAFLCGTNFWGYSFKEHPLTSNDVQIPKSKFLLGQDKCSGKKTIQEKFSNECCLDKYISALSNWVRFRKL